MPAIAGRKPELAYVPVDQIDVDHRYQRTLESKRSKARIEQIVAGWDWALCGVIKLSRDPETGRFWALDGQHRLAAAKRLRIPELPAEIVQADGVTVQARIFVSANRDRVTVNSFALHHALIAAGDDGALAIDRVCRAADVQIPRYPIPAANLKPNQTLGLGAVAKLIKQAGEADAIRTLKTLREAYPNQSGALRSHLILAVAALYAERPRLAPAAVIAALKRGSLDVLESSVAQISRHDGEGRAVVATRLIGAALNGEAPIPAAPPPVAKARPAPQAKPKPQGEALLPASKPAGKPNTVRQVSRAEAMAAVETFIATKGVTRCPTAAAAPTEGANIAPADKAAHARRHAAQEEEHQRKWHDKHRGSGRP